jgi:dihydrofolate synthase/folylpolyglutamate synthase
MISKIIIFKILQNMQEILPLLYHLLPGSRQRVRIPKLMDTDSIYQKTLEYLYSFVDYSLTRSTRYAPEHFDLGRMRDFLEKIGNPHQAYPVIHVAGTKGKGSVSALCASALQAAGYSVGLYTSPHLQDYAERIQINHRPIPHDELISLVDEFRPYLAQGTKLTTFEITTALAFLHFARQDVDVVVAEVGLGGRLDATNVVAPCVAVITSISYDHVDFLGESLTEIAGEKGGIIKNGVPVILAPQKDEARLTIEKIADERNAPLVQVGRDFLFEPISHSLENQTLLVWSPSEEPLSNADSESREIIESESNRLTIPLLGYHQIENAATAYTALMIARQCGLEVDDAAIRTGFANVDWPGRFEMLRHSPPVILDSAHNQDSALKLRLTLDEYFPGQPVVLVFGVSEDKNIEGMLDELMPRVKQVIVTRSYHPRAMEPEELEKFVQRFGKPIKVVPAVEDALDEAVQMAGGDSMVLVTGSIFVAAGARHTWYNRESS